MKKYESKEEMWQLFREIWDEREENGYCYCYETNQRMSGKYREMTTCYHHVLEKGVDKYRKYAMEKWNIIIVMPSIHVQIHRDIDKCPRVKQYTQKLKKKYG